MPNGRLEGHHGRGVGEIRGEVQLRGEESSFVQGVRRAHDQQFPIEDVLIFAKTNRYAIWWISGQIYAPKKRKKCHRHQGALHQSHERRTYPYIGDEATLPRMMTYLLKTYG